MGKDGLADFAQRCRTGRNRLLIRIVGTICPDGLGYLADLSCGDAWHRFSKDGRDPGRSIVIVRTARGKRILKGAIDSGYVHLEQVSPCMIYDAQRSLLLKKRELFGRLLALKLLGIPTPTYRGFSLFRSWMRLPLRDKARTIAGTFRRALTRNWRKPLSLRRVPRRKATLREAVE